MKSKIEEKIEKAREANNEMFAAFDELNEMLKEKEPEKWMPKRGEYATTVGVKGEKLIAIFREWKDKSTFRIYAGLGTTGCLMMNGSFGFLYNDIIRPATPEEIALLDTKLAEQGKRFDKEKLELVDIEKEVRKCATCYFCKIGGLEKPCITCTSVHDSWQPIPKHKEPVIGEMAIFWDDNKEMSFIAILTKADNGFYPSYFKSTSWENAILFESIEQYKAFLKS